MAVCTAWHDSPSPPYDTLGLVTLTFVLEKRKRLHPRSQTFATAVSNVCNCHRKRLRERLQSTEYFWDHFFEDKLHALLHMLQQDRCKILVHIMGTFP